MRPASEDNLSNFRNPGIQHHLGIMRGATTSFERGGAAFTTENLTGGRVVGLSGQSRKSLAFGEESTPPGYQQSQA